MRADRLLTGDDSSAFCHKVTRARAKVWEHDGPPTYAYDAVNGTMRGEQAGTKDVSGAAITPDLELRDL